MRAVLIGLTGRAGAGKSTAAHYLNAVHGFTRTRFAGPLKDMARAIGLTERHIEGDLKEQPCEMLGGKTPRFFMQRLGTDFGRDLISNDLWTNIWQEKARALLDSGYSVVADDCRFPNEVAAIRALGGHIVRIRTSDPPPAGDHISEQHDLPYDVSVLNDWHSLDVFHARLDGALDHLGGDHD
jgi:hypothetical protein